MASLSRTNFTLRGSAGIWSVNGHPDFQENAAFPKCTSPKCRVMAYSRDGSILVYCDGYKTDVMRTSDFTVVSSIDKPRTGGVHISPCNTLLATWEPYAVTKDNPAGTPNMLIWDIATGKQLAGFVRKKASGWYPQWSCDEVICARMANSEVHFFADKDFANPKARLHLQKMEEFLLAAKSGPPYYVAAHIPGTKGQPSAVRIFEYPNFGGLNSAVCHKGFYKADSVDMKWNDKGTGLLVLTLSESATTDSYYGEQGLHFMDIRGESCIVPRAKKGPIYCAEWSPLSSCFCVVYGTMPAKATLFNLKCEPIFDFGTGPRNSVYFSPFGDMLCLAGFGNLRSGMEVWQLADQKTALLSSMKAADTTYFEWCPDGIHILTATTSPRLRVGNGFRVWHFLGDQLAEYMMPGTEELWEVSWQPAPSGTFSPPQLSAPRRGAAPVGKVEEKPQAYVPPAMRNRPQGATKSLLKDDYEPPSNVKDQPEKEMSKQALKNKKKREAKARAKQEIADSAMSQSPAPAVPVATVVPPSATASVLSEQNPDKDKKLRNLRKKLQQIAKIKEQLAAGKQLEKNQIDKIQGEAVLLEEIEALELS